jgi:hypothetical protein
MTLPSQRIIQYLWIFLCTLGQRYCRCSIHMIRLKISLLIISLKYTKLDFKTLKLILYHLMEIKWILNCGLKYIFQEMVKNKTLIFSFDSTKKARFGVLPRYAKDEKLIRWFELPNCFIFHNGVFVGFFFCPNIYWFPHYFDFQFIVMSKLKTFY